MKDDIESTKRLMGVLVRQPPKPHEDMKMGKKKPIKSPDRSPETKGPTDKR
jgi:hypothetical protein